MELEQLFGDQELILQGTYSRNNKVALAVTFKEKNNTDKVHLVNGYLNFQSKSGLHNTLALDELFSQIESTSASRSQELKETITPPIFKEPTQMKQRITSIEILSESPASEVESEESIRPEIQVDFEDEWCFPEQDQEKETHFTFTSNHGKYQSQKTHEYEFMKRQHAEIGAKEYEILHTTQFLNDNIVMSYLYYISNSLISPAMKDRIYICDSYLYNTLEQSGTLSGIQKYFKARDYLKRETKLFEKDFWFFPICQSSHWSLVVICYPRLYFQSVEEQAQERPSFLVMDSLLGSNNPRSLNYNPSAYRLEYNRLLNFMEMEFSVRKLFSHPLSTAEEVIEAMKPYYDFSEGPGYHLDYAYCSFVDVPLQQNGYDCGIYLLQFAELFLRNPDFILNKTYTNSEEQAWFKTEMVERKRAQIAKIFSQIAEGNDPTPRYLAYFKEMERMFCYKKKI